MTALEGRADGTPYILSAFNGQQHEKDYPELKGKSKGAIHAAIIRDAGMPAGVPLLDVLEKRVWNGVEWMDAPGRDESST